MDKPLKDWTVGEIQAMCRGGSCGGCPFFTAGSQSCRVYGSPEWDWDLAEDQWTGDDVIDAISLQRVHPWVKYVRREKNDGRLYAVDEFVDLVINKEMLPGVPSGSCVALDTILGCDE